MSAVDELVKDNTRASLVERAEEYEINEYRPDGTQKNKSELAEDIVRFETGVPADAEIKEPEEEPEEETKVQEAPKPSNEKDYLVKYVGKAVTYQTGGQTFSRNAPFKVLSSEEAEKLFERADGDMFKVATPAEAKEFYS